MATGDGCHGNDEDRYRACLSALSDGPVMEEGSLTDSVGQCTKECGHSVGQCTKECGHSVGQWTRECDVDLLVRTSSLSIPDLTSHDLTHVKEDKRRWWIFSVCFLFQSLFGFNLYAPTVYLVYYTEAFTVSVATAAWICSIFYFTNFMIGSAVSQCVDRFGLRVTALFGSSVLSMSLLASAWSPTIYFMFVLQGFCAGVGAGFVFIPMNVVVPRHFASSRSFVSCLAISGLGVGMLVCPLVITHFVSEYGWRGSVLLHAGIMLHMLPLAMFFTEPRHTKKSEIGDEQDISEDDAFSQSPNDLNPKPRPRKWCAELVNNMCNLRLLRENPVFVLYSVSSLCCRLASTIVVTHLPRFFVTSGFSYEQAGVATSVSGGFNLLARFVASGVAATACMDLVSVYAALMFINGLSPILLLWLPGFTGKLTAAAVFGFAFGFDYMFVPSIVVQLVGLDLLASGLAMYNVISLAFIILIIPSFSGWLYDVTGSYAIAFYLGSGCAMCGVVLALTVSRLRARKATLESEENKAHMREESKADMRKESKAHMREQSKANMRKESKANMKEESKAHVREESKVNMREESKTHMRESKAHVTT